MVEKLVGHNRFTQAVQPLAKAKAQRGKSTGFGFSAKEIRVSDISRRLVQKSLNAVAKPIHTSKTQFKQFVQEHDFTINRKHS